MSARSPSTRQDDLAELLGPVVSAAGYDLEQVSVSQAGRRSLLRVVVDRDGGVSLDDVAEVSSAVSRALDAASDAIVGRTPYTLEVTSPGVDRPLTQPRHWRRATGRLVRVAAGEETLEGRVLDADESRVLLDVAGSPRELAYAGLGAGRVQVEFGRREDGGRR